MRPPLLLCLAAAVATAGCSYYQDQATAETAATRMVGMSRAAVLACMGPPLARMNEGDLEAWSYRSSTAAPTIITPVGSSLIASGGGTYDCTVDVILTGGAVSRVGYKAGWGGLGTPHQACAPAVRACSGE